MAAPASLEFEGTQRFEIRRRLGAGGMGVVYEAYDRDRDAVVALKTLATVDAGGIYRLKKEFRSLAGTSHPNLVVLHELVSVGDRWFFTMDLIEGVDFLTWARHGNDPKSAATLEMTPPMRAGGDLGTTGPRVTGSFDEPALRAAMIQLVRAVAALHENGKLHRDLKPSNVMVSADGHVTVLDFGLVTDEADAVDLYATLDDRVMGTPAYMAPEQAAGQPTTPASDWYAVGAMLYEALTGVLPFGGSVVHVLAMKQLRDPAPPRELVKEVPADLASLAMELLRRDPSERPSGDEVLRRLAGAAPRPRPASPPPRSVPELVGRDAQLVELAAALGDTRRGTPAVVGVCGASGMGKTALVTHFLDRLRAEGSTVVLAGRCYERESVPMKALDAAIDSLSRYLRHLPPEEVAAVAPRDAHALGKLFPVLRRVRAIDVAPRASMSIADAQELRRRAFGAFKELLARIADRRPLVVFVDDLQWGDADSAALIADVLRPPDPPAVLFIGAWRTEDGRSPLIAGLRDARDGVPRRLIAVEPLRDADARALADAMLAEAGTSDGEVANAIAREAEGSPFFVGELVRHVMEQRGAGETPRVRLEDVLTTRFARLPEGARRLLEVVAVAGGPVETTAAVRAAKLGRTAPAALVALRSGHLLRSQSGRHEEQLETYHDRVRTAVTQDLSPERLRTVHRRLARALMVSGDPDPEALAVHLEGAGERAEAATFARDAAAAAADVLAFDRAVRLYRCALSLEPDEAPERWQIQEALADALANEGRGAEAAEAYLAAATGAGDEAFELRRKAADHLVRSGHVERGLALTEELLREVGMRMPPTPNRALVSLVLRRAIAGVRGLGFRQRSQREVPADALRRVDTAWSMASGLSMVDPIRGAELQTRHLSYALATGEPYRVARALALEAAHLASLGKLERAAGLLDRAESLAARVDEPHAAALCGAMRGACAFFAGDWPASFDHTQRAEVTLRERCTNVAWERATNMRFNLVALYYMGRLGELSRRVPGHLARANERDDLFARACAGSGCAVGAWLCVDDVGAADANLDELESQLATSRGYHLQHYMLLQGRTHTDLYGGRYARAWERMGDEWPRISGSLMLRVSMLRAIMLAEHASCALAVGELDAAAADAKRLRGMSLPWASAMAQLVAAGLAHRRGQPDAALTLLDDAARALDRQHAKLFAASARLHRAALLGGDEGRALRETAERAFREEDVRSPEPMAHALCAGFRP